MILIPPKEVIEHGPPQKLSRFSLGNDFLLPKSERVALKKALNFNTGSWVIKDGEI